MAASIVARTYAEALFELGERHEAQSTFAAGMEELARALDSEPRIVRFLDAPRVDAAAKRAVVAEALGGRVPELLLRFLLVVIEKRRAGLLREIAREYQLILDEAMGRVHVQITLAREPDERLEREIATELSKMLGRKVIPHVLVDPDILGGIIIRYGDRRMDGSLRRRVGSLRRRLTAAALPETIATTAGDGAAPQVGA